MRSSASNNQYSHSYNNHDMPNANRGRHSHHGNHQRYNNPNPHSHANYNSNRQYQPNRTNQHHSQYPRTSNHINHPNPNHMHSPNPRRTNHNHHHSQSHPHPHSNNNPAISLHSNSNNRGHNQSHSSRVRNNHHRPYQHNQHPNNNNRANFRNNRRSNHRNPHNPNIRPSRGTANRSRNIRIYTSSHNYPPRSNSHTTHKPVLNLIDNNKTVKKAPVPVANTNTCINKTSHSEQSVSTSKPKSFSTSNRDNLSTAMSELCFDGIPFKYDYKSKVNLSLLSLKNGGKMAMDPTQIYEWKFSNEEERKTQVRHYMLPCLKLLNHLQCMDEAIDFIFAPDDRRYNPDYYLMFTSSNAVDRNVCLEWICNLLKSDYYETVDDFAADIRLMFENTFKIFGYKHEWSKNCRVLQRTFEEKMILIPRDIPNAQEIFVENGNPSNDVLQKEFLELDENRKEIEECLKKLEQEKSNELDVEMEVDVDMADKKNEPENEKTAHQKYLSNIDTKNIYRKNRKRATKQTLKQVVNSNELEEGEVIMRLDEKKLGECEVWFDFVQQYGTITDKNVIDKVLMVQEGFGNRNALKLKGNNLKINMRTKSAEIQNAMYKMLENAQKKVSKKKEFSSNVLNELFEKKRRKKEGKMVEDPYSNVVIERKRMELKVKQDEERKERQLFEKQQDETMEEMDEDSDEFFDTLHLEDVGMNGGNNQNEKQKQEIISNFDDNVNNNVLSKDNYSHNTYKPIMPSNVDVDDIALQRQTSDDKYKEFSWKNEQGQEEIDF